tara:strand:- start:1724 stop:2383 length:660 start_codon:yes stop_codon:yes gene_type:complete
MNDKFTRLEKKWVFKNKDKETLTQNLISHNLYFRPHFKERFVNSIYFDNLDLKFAEDNLAGVSNRKKVRLRWYSPNSNTLINPILEVKVKKNFQGFKKLFAFKEFDNFKVNEKNLKKISEKINNILVSKNLIPITQVFYKRNYFISCDKRVRATLDVDLKYRKIKNFIQSFFVRSDDIVLEFKYSNNFDSYLRNNIKGITRVSRNSKYINSLEKNNFFQ